MGVLTIDNNDHCHYQYSFIVKNCCCFLPANRVKWGICYSLPATVSEILGTFLVKSLFTSK